VTGRNAIALGQGGRGRGLDDADVDVDPKSSARGTDLRIPGVELSWRDAVASGYGITPIISLHKVEGSPAGWE
jgi:hypothetical protein